LLTAHSLALIMRTANSPASKEVVTAAPLVIGEMTRRCGPNSQQGVGGAWLLDRQCHRDGANRGSSPLGSANDFSELRQFRLC
jgi:hypothetical protein